MINRAISTQTYTLTVPLMVNGPNTVKDPWSQFPVVKCGLT